MQPNPSERPASTESASVYPRRPTKKKSVSLLPPRVSSRNPEAHEKILQRKPTPFNSDLAEQIRNSGILAAIERGDLDVEEDDDDDLENEQEEDAPQNGSLHHQLRQSPALASERRHDQQSQQQHMPTAHPILPPEQPNGVHLNIAPPSPPQPVSSPDDRPQLPQSQPPTETSAEQNGHALDN